MKFRRYRAVGVVGIALALVASISAVVLTNSPALAAGTCNQTARVYRQSDYTALIPASAQTTDGLTCNMAQGAVSEAVRQLQRNLNACYSAGLTADGQFGPATKSKLQAAQSAEGITADGSYGPTTRNYLKWYEYEGETPSCRRIRQPPTLYSTPPPTTTPPPSIPNCNQTARVYRQTDYTALIPAAAQTTAGLTCNLEYGMNNEAVRQLQRNLNACYNAGLTADGQFGPNTRTALTNAQSVEGVAADGQFGPNTRDYLKWYEYEGFSPQCRRVRQPLTLYTTPPTTPPPTTPPIQPPTRSDGFGNTTVIFVHGFLHEGYTNCASEWAPEIQYFQAHYPNIQIATFGYYADNDGCTGKFPGGTDTPLEIIGLYFAQWIYENYSSQDRNNDGYYDKVDIVAHSTGGLIARYALMTAEQSSVNLYVEDVVTLGTPHQGVNLGNPTLELCILTGTHQCHQLASNSDFIASLQAVQRPGSAMQGDVDWTVMASFADDFVAPWSGTGMNFQHGIWFRNLDHTGLRTTTAEPQAQVIWTGAWPPLDPENYEPDESEFHDGLSPVALAYLATYFHSGQ